MSARVGWRVVASLASIAAATALFGACGSNSTNDLNGGPGGGGGTDGGGGDANACGTRVSCGGTCVDVGSDVANCGSCGHACAAGDLCCAGACAETKSCDYRIASLDPPSGKLNGGEWITIKGSGFGPKPRVMFGDGRAPARTVDPQTIIAQAPPGLEGDVDVTVTLGGAGGTTAGLRNGYRYIKAGLKTPWQVIAMETVRGEDPGLAVLQDGRVGIFGGTTVPDHPEDALPSIDLFLRKDEKVALAPGNMGTPRWHSSAVTMLNGKVLVVGAACQSSPCPGAKVADLFDPATGAVTQTKSSLNKERMYTRSVLLPDGRVFVSSLDDPSVEIYDPDTDSFTLVPHDVLHVRGFVVRLRDGRVLLATGTGGNTNAELFDPDTNTFTATGKLQQGREMLTAHTLPDGRVMVIGGASESAGGIKDPLKSIELYDPKTGTFSLAPYTMTIGRTWHASALVRDGTVLAMGGYTVSGDCGSSVGSVDIIDPLKGTVTPFEPLPQNKTSTEWTAVTLLDGSIVAVGGGACGTTKALPEVYFLPGDPTVQ